MNLVRKYSLFFCCCGLMGCGAGSTLNCTDSPVRAATLETAMGQVRDLVLYDALGRRKLLEVALTHPKYDEFKMRTDASYVKDVVADVETFLRAKEFSIEAARAQPAIKETHSTLCAADFVMKGPDGTKKFPIKYSVRSADDGKTLHVELEGL
jgi:hypothetical protein